jgi:predicted nucleic acid-binding protein
MSGDFIDSNVLLYLFSVDEPKKREIATSVVQQALHEGSGVISFQVVQEVLNGVTRFTDPPVSEQDARLFLTDTLAPLWQVFPSERLYEEALRIRSRYRFSFYDSLIVASALRGGCTRLLSEDLQHGQRVEQLTIANPFLLSAT